MNLFVFALKNNDLILLLAIVGRAETVAIIQIKMRITLALLTPPALNPSVLSKRPMVT